MDLFERSCLTGPSRESINEIQRDWSCLVAQLSLFGTMKLVTIVASWSAISCTDNPEKAPSPPKEEEDEDDDEDEEEEGKRSIKD